MMANIKEEYEVVDHITGDVIGVYSSEKRARKEQQKLLRKNKEIAVMEQICLPALIVRMFEINERKKRSRVEINKPIKDSIQKFIDDIAGSEGKGRQVIRIKRLVKVVNKIREWAVRNKFDTRKMILMSIELMCALNGADLVEYTEELVKTIMEMQEHIEGVKDDISGFDKLEASVVKKAPQLLKVLQEMGYFKF